MTDSRRSLRAEAERLYRGGVRRVAFRSFPLMQRLGVHVVANSFNTSPIPDTRELDDSFYRRYTEMVGVDMREGEQFALLERFSKYHGELTELAARRTTSPGEFAFDNERFSGGDARVLWCVLREFQPRHMVEVGSGMSTVLSAEALRRNRDEGGTAGELTAIEPWPPPFLDVKALEVVTLLPDRVEDLGMSIFTDLDRGDVLFIDSSHILKAGGDVQYLYLEVLPRLAPGVWVHIHDINLPMQYPRAWVEGERRFWNEQYLLQAFLAFNSGFEVVWANQFMHCKDRSLVREKLGSRPNEIDGGSFWMVRK